MQGISGSTSGRVAWVRSRWWLVVAIAAALALWPAASQAAAPFVYVTPPTIAGGLAPTISIDDVSQFEGSPSGITAYTFTVSLSAASTDQIEVTAETADDSATTADSDYSPRTPTILTFDPGETQQQFIVNANRDTKFETDEAFKVKLTVPTNATIADDEGLGTIKNDDGQPTISIDDVSHDEGNASTTSYGFNVTLSNPSYQQVQVTAQSQDDSATLADSDYQQLLATVLTFNPGETSKPVTVQANGDTKFEPDEAFKVKLSAPANATIADDEGLGTIRNDDGQPTISIDDVSHDEGNASTTSYTFTISLSNPSYLAVAVSADSANDSATLADNDYQQLITSVTFSPGQTSAPVTVQVNGDTTVEPNEAFKVNLSAATNASIADGEGIGTILNDDVVSGPQTVSFQAQADARVEDDHESTNYGTSTLLQADDEPEIETFLRFNLTGISGTIKSAKLRLFATDGTSNGPAAYKTNWTGAENALTWKTRTPRTSAATDDKGSISSNTFVEYNVTPLVTGNGQHSFILATTSSDGVDFASRETTTVSRRPELIVTYGTDTQNPTSPTLSAAAAGSNRVDLSWSGATDDFGVTGYKIYRNNSLLTTVGVQSTYADTTVTAGGTYTYEVTALDGAGHESAPRSNAVTVKIPIVVTAQADARVEEDHKSTNYGTSTTLRAVGGSNPDVETFIRFQLSGVTTVSNAKLRLWVTNATSNGPAAYKTSWSGSETSLNWNNRTSRTSGATDDKGAISADAYVDYNVTSLISGNGAHSFILATTSSDGVDFASRETSTTSRRPQLLITP